MSCCDGKIHTKTIIKGALGLAKSFTNVGIAEDSVIQARRDICRVCDHSEKKDTPEGVKVRKCNLCLCLIAHKTRIKSEKCCDKRW